MNVSYAEAYPRFNFGGPWWSVVSFIDWYELLIV